MNESTFLEGIRQLFLNKSVVLSVPKAWEEKYDPSISQTYITLYQKGRKPLRWGTKKQTLLESILRIVHQLKTHKSFKDFTLDNREDCRIMFEFVTEVKPCNIRNLTTMKFVKDRFEPGVSGLKAIYENEIRYFMPTDALTHSVMSVRQLLHFFSKRFGISKQTTSISKRIHLMRRLPIHYEHIRSCAYISYGKKALHLHRGLPPVSQLSQKDMMDKTQHSLQWLVDNQKNDGSFTYYYDPNIDSYVDFAHPKMVSPLYNNILRHSGGTITLLRGYSRFKDKHYLNAARKSINFFVDTLRTHTYNDAYACYPFFNKKSKLGGAGIGLVSLMEYRSLSQDKTYDRYILGLVRHILSRIEEDGEMLGYYIHPLYNNGEPIIAPDEEGGKSLFSFYYPGEALLGLALFYRHFDEEILLKQHVFVKSRQAMDFLIDIRPIKYKHLFDTLPSDAWLMQAIESWTYIGNFTQQKDLDFVFNDTQRMFDHMYQQYNTNKETKDYIGGFYYQYGDHVYHDASRNEGIVAAYFLAKHLGKHEKAEYIMTHMLQSAQGLMLTYHSPESSYMHRYPEKSIGTFRFKLTRQWIRIDSIQHAVCFLLRLCDAGITESAIKKAEKTKGFIDSYKILKHIDKSGFSDVYLVKKPGSKNKKVIKRLLFPEKDIDFIRSETNILYMLNDLKGIPKFYGLFHYSDGSYLLFDYIEGERLNRHIKKHDVFSTNEVLLFLETITNILSTCQEKSILHLDIKTGNIMYDKKSFYLIDWGLSVESKRAITSHLKGNPIYFAPETYQGYRTTASDIYAMGCTIYEMLTGQRIFGLRKADTLVKKMFYHCYCEPQLDKITSLKIRYLLSRMLDKDIEKRVTLQELKTYIKEPESSFSHFTIKQTILPTLDETEMLNKMVKDAIPYALLLKARKIMEQNASLSPSDIESLLKPAAKNLPEADALLGIIYFEQRRYEEAYIHLLSGEKTLEGKASYYLSFMFEHGLSVKKDIKKALHWLKHAYRQGYRPAEVKLKKIIG